MKLISIITKHLPLVTVAILMAACASEDFVGDERLHEANENGRPVSFDLVAAPQTRAVYGGEAAELLNNNFVVWGDKTMSDNTTQTVFNNYQVNYTANTANTTTTNSAGWEYIGCENVPGGVTSGIGVTAFSESESNTGVYQSIKYWDFSATQYNFFAYSLGKGYTTTGESPTTTYATSTAMDKTGYSLTGSVDELSACYISDKVVIPHDRLSSTNTQVSLQFRNLGAKVKIALYETIPGYSVKDVKFYQSASATTSGTTAYLYAADGTTAFNRGDGTFAITFTESTPNLGWTAATSSTDNTYISFGDAVTTLGTTWTGWQGKEYRETDENVYIGRSSTQATGPADFVTVLPYPEGTPLALKVDYTLLSRDNSNENIYVTGATATVPAQFAAWKPNCSYTYIFKISDNTPGQTGPGSTPAGLYPITLDAVVNVDADGKQETITTVTEPEPTITTYQKGSDYATTGEYDASNGDIYVTVMDGTDVQTLTVSGDDINAKLFTATIEAGAAETITEITVAKAIAEGDHDTTTGTWTLTDSNGKNLVVTEVADGLTVFTEIPGTATPDGKPITIDGAKFTPEVGTTYVFQFSKGDPAEYQYKVIKVKAATP